MSLCEFVMADGQDNCTNGVGDIGTSTLPTVGLDISDQVNNAAGTFNLTQLREQARSFPYVMTDLLMNRSDIMMLYQYVLPGRPVPNLDFLNDAIDITIATPSVSPSTITTDTPSNTQSNTPSNTPLISATSSTANVPPSPTSITPSTTATSTPAPSNTPSQNGATAVSRSLFITLISLLLARVL